MRRIQRTVLAATLVLGGVMTKAQGLQGIIVEDYYTITAADKAYIDGLGGDPINVGTKVYRIYVDMAPNYKLNTVFGSPTGGSNNPLSISTTTSFWNDINNGTEVPTQTRFLDEGAAFDTYITIGRTGTSGGAAGCGSNAAQVGVLKTADTNGNLTLCSVYENFPSGAGTPDGNIPATSTALTYNVGGLVDLAPLTTTGNNFTVVGDAWATLPNSTGVDPTGTNRVLIGQFTTDGVLSFHINVQLQQPTGGVLESYVWNQAGSGEVVSPFLTYPQPVTGCSSSQSVYVKPLGVGNTTTSLLTVGDAIGGYQMVGIPDGLGAFDNGNGTFTLLMNHELGNAVGAQRAHGSIGSFVSKWVLDKSTLCVQSGSDLITTVKLWNGTAFVTSPGTAFNRLCSADLPPVSAFYNAGTGKGTQERIYMNGEESGNEGRAFGHIATGPNAGTTYQLPYLGRFSWENSLACPSSGDKTVVIGLDDTTPGQVYVYIGSKKNSGTEIDKAGLNNGKLFGVKVTGLPLEISASVPAANSPFTLFDLGFVQNTTGANLNTASNTAGVTQFLRPEDGHFDPSNPNDFYFLTTNNFTSPSRMWKLHFTDILNPELGGTITAVIDGTEAAGQKMMDNMTIDQFGQAWIQEDPGNQAYIARMHKYDIATDVLTPVAYHDSSRFVTGGANFLTQDEESSGIIDMKDILGKGRFLFVDQAHYATNPTLVEGGQLLEFATGDTLNPCVPASIASLTGATTQCSADTLALNSSASGTLPISYSWSGTGSFLFGSTSPSALLTGAASGSYTLTVTNACGTDNDAVAVTVNPTTNDTTTVSACDTYTWSVNNQVYTASGTYTSVGGCDTDVLVLTITPSTGGSLMASACDTYTWTANNQTYTASGTYTNTVGCNTDTLVLTITPSAGGSLTISACDSYTWTANNQTYTASGTYTNTVGCNTDTLVLTINQSSGSSLTISACDSYTWTANNQTYTASGTYTNTVGCNTDTLVLTITPVTGGSLTASACGTYTWTANNQTYTASGTYTNTVGCNTDTLVLTLTIPGTACDDGNPNTTGDVYDATCVCVGTPVGNCTQNEVTLTLTTDANGGQTSYDIVVTGTSTVVCSGSGFASSSTITATCCLPNGCYDLRVFDSAGDGIANPGGYVLRDANNNRIIDNTANGSTFVSSSISPLGFCVPLGSGSLDAATCDLLNATPTTVLHAVVDPAVSSVYIPGHPNNANSGYQFWVTNPNGGYSRRILITHASPGSAWPVGTPAAQKATYFRINAMSSAPVVPQGLLLNVRVRSLINGTYGVFGPACRLLLPVPPCQPSQLTTTANPVASCGATGLTLASTIYATPVTGATSYQFEFSKAGYLRRITLPVRQVALNFLTAPLQNNNCYDVRVRVTTDGGITFCPFGPTCTITIGNATCGGSAMAPHADDNSIEDIALSTRLSIWPNPNDGSLLHVSLSDLDGSVNTVAVDVTDAYGKLVLNSSIPVQDGLLNSSIDLQHDLAPGLYLVNLQAGDQRYTERLVIQ